LVYSFDDVVVDGPGFRVRRGARTLELEPKALEVLLALLDRRGQLVTKAEIQAAVWPDTAVTESALTRVVAQLRKALGDDARDARYIETVPTRGYRFIAPVTTSDAPAVAVVHPVPSPPRVRRAGAWIAAALAVAAAFALLRTRPWPAALPSGADRSRVLLTAAPGLNAFPAFSPDGGSLAFVSDRTGSLEIYVRALPGSAREVPVTSDGQQNLQPAWSPDGRQIAYASLGRGGIWAIPALGGTPRQLTTFGARPAWSPDGSTVVFQSQTPTFPLLSSAGSGSTLWTVPAAGDAPPRPLTERRGWGHGAPAFAPGGRRVAYAAGRSVWTIGADGRDARPLQDFDHDVDGLVFAPDASALYVAFTASSPTDTAPRFVRLPLAPEAKATAGPPLELTDLASGGGQFALAPDGRTIAFVEPAAEHEIVVLDLGPDGSSAGPERRLVPQLSLRAMAPAFSPDGTRVAIAVFRPGEGWTLWIAAADGSGAEQVRTAPIARSSLSWLDDGRIVATEPAGPGRSRLVAFDPANGREQVLFSAGFVLASARVAAAGSRFAFMRPDPDTGVFQAWTADLPGGEPRPATRDPEGAGWPTLSRDGTTLADELLRRGDTQLAVAGPEGLRPLAGRPSQNWPGEFSSDGRRFVFAAQRAGVWNVCQVDVATADERCLTSYTRFDGYVRTPTISPAGDRVVFERAQVRARIWLGRLPG
jgi:Tol biopolymer transport system component/DNA-binding winged helix-turn-helix (wHTH) protein